MKKGGLAEKEQDKYVLLLAQQELARLHKLEAVYNVKLGFYEKRGPSDYGGTLRGGRSCWYEVKETQEPEFDTSMVLLHQRETLASHAALGAVTFILVRCNCPGVYYGTWYALPNDERVLTGKRPWADLQPWRLQNGCQWLDGLRQ